MIGYILTQLVLTILLLLTIQVLLRVFCILQSYLIFFFHFRSESLSFSINSPLNIFSSSVILRMNLNWLPSFIPALSAIFFGRGILNCLPSQIIFTTFSSSRVSTFFPTTSSNFLSSSFFGSFINYTLFYQKVMYKLPDKC